MASPYPTGSSVGFVCMICTLTFTLPVGEGLPLTKRWLNLWGSAAHSTAPEPALSNSWVSALCQPLTGSWVGSSLPCLSGLTGAPWAVVALCGLVMGDRSSGSRAVTGMCLASHLGSSVAMQDHSWGSQMCGTCLSSQPSGEWSRRVESSRLVWVT